MAIKARIGLAVAATLAGAALAGVTLSGAALASTTDRLVPRLGYYSDTAPVASGLNFLAPRGAYRRLAPAPWTAQWYTYCSRRYVSFNRDTGMYISHSGKYRFCR